jgi:CubicO group peptidase (beta-lactamase class C family)
MSQALWLSSTPLAAQNAQSAREVAYPHAAEPIGTVRQMYNGALTPDLAVNTFLNIDRLFPTRLVPRSANPLPLPPARTELTTVTIFDRGRNFTLDEYIDLNRVAGLIVLKDGRVAFETYRFGNTDRTRWMSMSIAKSITSTLFGAAVKQGLIRLTDSVTHYVPSLRGSAYDGVTVRHRRAGPLGDPKERVVVVVWSAQTKPSGQEMINEWAFFDAVVSALR